MNVKPLMGAFTAMPVTVRTNMNEDNIEHLFQPVYVELGYLNRGKDILGKRESKSGIPDVQLLLNSDENVQVIVELKKL